MAKISFNHIHHVLARCCHPEACPVSVAGAVHCALHVCPSAADPSSFAGTLVKDGAFEEIKNADYDGKWVVLFFYPLDFTCTYKRVGCVGGVGAW